MAVGDTWRLTMFGQLQGQTIENVLHYYVTDGTSQQQAADALLEFASTTLLSAWSDAQSNEFVYVKATAQKIAPPTVSAQYAIGLSGAGIIDAPALPAEVAAVLKKLTNFGGVRFRGRAFLAGVPEGNMVVATGRWAGEYRSKLESAADVLKTVIAPGGLPVTLIPIIFNRATGTNTSIVRTGIDDVPRAQRRRQPGRGI